MNSKVRPQAATELQVVRRSVPLPIRLLLRLLPRVPTCRIAIVGATIFILALPGVSEARAASDEPSWTPYAEFGFDSGEEITGATVVSSVGAGSTGSNSSDPTRLRFAAGALTPSWTSLAGQPRLFFQGGVDFHAAGSERAIEVGRIGVPEDAIARLTLNSNINNDAEDIAGQGQYIRQEYIGPAWNAALGVAFTVPAPWDDGSIRLKPLAAYEGERVRIEGRLTQVSEPSENVFVVYRAMARKNPRTDHRLGVGGEVELVFFQGERVEMSAFANVRYLWLLGGRSTEFSDSTGIARFEWRGDANVLRGGLGFRVGWTGFQR
jgi:hypothetical protein